MASHCTEVWTRSICNAPAALRASRSGQDLAPALPRRLSTVIIIITTCFPNYDPRAGGPPSGIPTGPVLVRLLETSAVVAQQLIKSTTCTWMGMGPGAGRVYNDRPWTYHALSYSAFDPSRRPKPNYQLTT